MTKIQLVAAALIIGLLMFNTFQNESFSKTKEGFRKGKVLN